MDEIALRPATAEDFGFFFALHKESLGPYVDQVWGWEDDDQRAYLERNLVLPHTRVIVVNGSDVGRLDLEDHGDELFLALIEIAAEHRCRGIGGQLIQALLNDGLRGRQASTTQRAASQYSGLPALPAARFHRGVARRRRTGNTHPNGGAAQLTHVPGLCSNGLDLSTAVQQTMLS